MPIDPYGPTGAGPLPSSWPSAWSSMRSKVLVGMLWPLVAAGVVLLVLALTQTLQVAWWVALLPLPALCWPLSLPARVRAVLRDAAAAHTVDIVRGQLGVIVTARHRRLGVRPNAEVVGGRVVGYYLNSGRRAPRGDY